MRIGVLLLLASLVLAGCGKGKTPESETAVEAGKKPKQMLDKAQSDVDKAMQKEAERLKNAEKKE